MKVTIKHFQDTSSYVSQVITIQLFVPLSYCTSLLSEAHVWLWVQVLFHLSGRLPVVFRPTSSFEVVHPSCAVLLYSTHWDKSATLCCIAACSQSSHLSHLCMRPLKFPPRSNSEKKIVNKCFAKCNREEAQDLFKYSNSATA